MNKVLSNEFLLKEIAVRLKSKRPFDEADSSIYQEFLNRAQRRFKWVNYMTPENLLKIEGMPDYFKTVADKAIKVDRVKETKKHNILAAIEDILQYLEEYPTQQNLNGLSIESGPGKGNIVIAKILVNHAKVYNRKAFQSGMFDMAGVSIADAGDILRLAQAIYKGDFKTAYTLNDFDTNVREELPNRAYLWMQRNLEA